MTVRPPKYQLHKATGQARVRIKGRDIYLGKYRSPESEQRYRQVIADWSNPHFPFDSPHFGTRFAPTP